VVEGGNIFNSSSKITYTYNEKTYTNYLGNYWSDYKEKYPDAEEIDGTGIWDIPYSINSDKDNYPLKEPFQNYFKPSININQIIKDAKLIEKVQTNSTVDLDAIIDDSDFNATLQGDYAVWEEELDDYIFKGTPAGTPSCPAGVAGYSKSPITIKIAVSKDGFLYLGTFNGTARDNLLIFSQNHGFSNYHDFSGYLLNKSQYGEPHDIFLDLDARQNLLAYIFGQVYKDIYNKGYITSGPTNYYELYNCNYSLENRFNRSITVIRSFIYHQQFDYGWYNENYRPIEEARNAKWSPIANNSNQNRDLSRSFDVEYSDVSHSFVWIQAHTDNTMHSDVTIYSMENPPDYSCSGGDWRRWNVTYDHAAKTYNVHNDNCAAAELFLNDQLPDNVQMEGCTTWSLLKSSVTIAVLGDMTTSNHTESPSHGDDNNPAPLIWRIEPSKPSPNLLKNPDFEDKLLYWGDTKDSATYTASDQEPYEGSYCTKGVEVHKGNLGRLYQDVTGIVKVGERYKIGGWIKTEDVVGNVVIALDYVDEYGWCPSDGYVKEIGHVAGTTDWTYYESEWFMLPPMPEDCVAAWFLFDFNNGKGTAYWDDVLLIHIPQNYTDEFRFVNVTLMVKDINGLPINGAAVKAFSEDLGIKYLSDWGVFSRTDENGNVTFAF
jgi:hypothetical protein